ncbi:MAG: hypothetical protein ABGY13_12820 [Verrucomicrobiia bacterium]
MAKRIGVPGGPLPVQSSQRSGILVGREVTRLGSFGGLEQYLL